MELSPELIEEAKTLWKAHIETAEPLDAAELDLVVSAGLANREDFEDRGGGLYWHAPTWPASEE
jgi:hypothetical protein